MVPAIDFGLVVPGIYLACLVKVVLQFSRYSLYTNKNVAFCSWIFMLLPTTFCLDFIFIAKIYKQGESTFQISRFMTNMTVKESYFSLNLS